jgi:hypothetical protein
MKVIHVSEEQRATLRTHLEQGRSLAKQEHWFTEDALAWIHKCLSLLHIVK